MVPENISQHPHPIESKKAHIMKIIAHRGATENALENSWSSFQQAVAVGCHRIELDVRLTRDKVPVIIHDQKLDRTCTTNGLVTELNINEIQSIRLKNGERIPLFAEVLEEFGPKIEINAEIKGNCVELAEIVARMVAVSPFKDQVLLSTFSEKPLLYLKRNYPTIQRAVLWGYDTLRTHPLYFFNPLWFLRNCGTKIFHPEASLLNSRMVDQLKQHDYIIFPWVPMKGEDYPDPHQLWRKMHSLKVDGLCTNKPKELLKYLSKKG